MNDERTNVLGLRGYYATAQRNTQETLRMCQGLAYEHAQVNLLQIRKKSIIVMPQKNTETTISGYSAVG
jgi:hypothetical protein